MSVEKNQNDNIKSSNPWECVSQQDYNQHMKSPSVFQSQTLGMIMKGFLQRMQPEAVLVLGCVDGNGFEYIDDGVTKEVFGVDINREFLNCCRSRFGKSGRYYRFYRHRWTQYFRYLM